MSPDSSTDILDLVIPGYEILGPIGSGGMGRVYSARQLNLGRRVAIKVLTIDPAGDHPERIARFRREAEIMAGLSHPHVLPVFDFGEVDGRPYLVLEFVEGGDLRRIMPEGRAMPVAKVVESLGPVAEALEYLHARRILHRDLKPENILIQDGVPKVADFGVAVSRSGSDLLTRTGQRLGTLGYVAPEQQYQLPVDHRADEYSLAALAYEMLTGQRPLGIFKPPSVHNPRLSPRVDAILMKALQEEPKDRFPGVPEFWGELREALEPRDSRSGLAWKFAAALTLLLALVVAGLAWILRREAPATLPLSTGADSAAKPPAYPGSDERHRLVQLRSNALWIKAGRPQGEDRSREFWFRAEAEIKEEVEKKAYQLWVDQGKPTGEAGRIAAEKNNREAERLLLEELKAEDRARPAGR